MKSLNQEWLTIRTLIIDKLALEVDSILCRLARCRLIEIGVSTGYVSWVIPERALNAVGEVALGVISSVDQISVLKDNNTKGISDVISTNEDEKRTQ